MEGNQTCCVDSSDSDIKKLAANAVLERAQKSQKNVYARFNCNIALAANAVLESTKKSKKCLHAVQLQYENYW